MLHKKVINKKLLKKIKQEGIPEIFNEGLIHSDIICAYLDNKSYPDVEKMSNEELFTYQEELLDWNCRQLPKMSPNFHLKYYYQYGGVIYDIQDELDYREWMLFDGPKIN